MNDCENISDVSTKNGPDSVLSLRSGVDDPNDIGHAERYRDTKEDIESRKSSISNGTIKSHAEAENVANPAARSDGR